MPKNNIYEVYNIPASGATKSFDIENNIDIYEINSTGGAVALVAPMVFSVTGTPRTGQEFKFVYGGGVTQNPATGANVSFLGVTLTDAQALQELLILTYYNGSTWEVRIIIDANGSAVINGSSIVASTIDTTQLKARAVTIDKMALLTRGSIIVGGAADAPTSTSFKASGYMPIGDGTDIVPRAISGDVTISSTGVVSIGTGKVTPTMLSFGVSAPLEVTAYVTTAQALVLNSGDVRVLIPAPGANKYIKVLSAEYIMPFKSVAYATNLELQLINTTADLPQMLTTEGLPATVSKTVPFKIVGSIAAGETCIMTNEALILKVKTGDPTTGDSDFRVHVTYQIITII